MLKVDTTVNAHSVAAGGGDTKQHQFNPYADNGGSCAAIAGKDYCILASDTRLSKGYSILSRETSKVAKINKNCIIAAGGMQADRNALFKVTNVRHTMYEHQHFKPMSTKSVAQLISVTLYGKRFFPYYTFNLVAGIDENGAGQLFGYDAVGSMEQHVYGAQGSGSVLSTPLLDNQVGFLTQKANKKDLSLEEARELLIDAFTSTAERDIHTGDSIELFVITKEHGVQREVVELRDD